MELQRGQLVLNPDSEVDRDVLNQIVLVWDCYLQLFYFFVLVGQNSAKYRIGSQHFIFGIVEILVQIKNVSSNAFRLVHLHHLHRLLVQLLDRLSDALLDGLGRVISLNDFTRVINTFLLLLRSQYLHTFHRMLRNFAWRFLKEMALTIDGVQVFSVHFH